MPITLYDAADTAVPHKGLMPHEVCTASEVLILAQAMWCIYTPAGIMQLTQTGNPSRDGSTCVLPVCMMQLSSGTCLATAFNLLPNIHSRLNDSRRPGTAFATFKT